MVIGWHGTHGPVDRVWRRSRSAATTTVRRTGATATDSDANAGWSAGRRQVEELSVRRTEYVRSAPSSAPLPNARGQKRLRRITLNWKFHFTPFNAVWHSSTEVPAQGIRGDRFRGSAPIAKEFRVASRRLLLRFFLLIQWRVALPISRIGCSIFA